MENNPQNTQSLKTKIKIMEDILNNPTNDLRQEVADLLNEKYAICKALGEIDQTQRCVEGYKVSIVLPVAESELKQWRFGLSEEVRILKAVTAETDKKIVEAEANRIAQENAAKNAQFDTHMQNGDAAMGSQQYDNAMNHYSQAKNNAVDAADSALAQRKYNEAFEAKKTAERKIRVDQQKARDEQENLQYAGMAAGVGRLMAFLNDSYSAEWYAMKFQLGLGYESLPIISNNISEYHEDVSYIENFGLPTFHLGFTSGFFNNKGISLHLNPQFNMGFSAFSAGTRGGYISYGGNATIYFGRKHFSKFRVFAEGGYFKKDGTYSYDADAAATEETSATDDVREGEFNYGILRYGGGFMVHRVEAGTETYIRPGAFLQTASFLSCCPVNSC
jgi:hypothetical protein